jgi:Amt family ammonium transporter
VFGFGTPAGWIHNANQHTIRASIVMEPNWDIGGGYILQANAGPKAGLFFGGGFDQLLAQLIGVASVGGFTVAFSFIAWYAISLITGGIRVDAEEEFKGLDISEHGMEAYSGFSKESE